MAGPFDAVLGGADKPKGPFAGVLAPDKTAALEQQAAESGAPAIPQDSPGLAQRAIDLLSRGNYASAGYVEEILAGHGPAVAAARAAREIGSGLPGVQGQKRGFGEVLERAGVPKLGSITLEPRENPFKNTIANSPLMPDYLRKLATVEAPGGEVTGRGALGFGLDVAADPLTYVTGGESSLIKAGAVGVERKALSRAGAKLLVKEMASGLTREAAEESVLLAAAKDASLLDRGGIKFAGKTIPGTPEAFAKTRAVAAGASRTVADAVGKLPGGQAVLDGATKFGNAVDSVFHRDIYGREVPGYLADKQAFIDRHAVIDADLKDRAAKAMSGLRQRARFKPVIDAYQAGGLAAPMLSGVERGGMTGFENLMRDMANEEISRGLLNPESVRQNYVPQFYENTPAEIERVVQAMPRTTRLNQATIGRHNEVRVFENYAQAVKVSTDLHALDPSIPILRPIYDPYVIAGKRIEAHATAVAFDDFYKLVGEKYGQQLPFAPGEFMDLTREHWPGKLTAMQTREYQAIQSQIARPHKPVDFVGRLTPEGRAEFLRQRFMKAESPAAMLADMDRFAAYSGDFPKQIQSLAGTASYDGTPYQRLTGIKALRDYDLPGGVAMDMAHIAESTQPWLPKYAARELGALVRGYDRVNNWFKSGVTVLFPAFHARNAYSNLAQGFADIGISALHPGLHMDTVGVLAGKQGAMRTWLGEQYSYDQLRQLMKDYQIKVSGRQALEFTGEAPLRAGIAEHIGVATGTIETEARAQLFMNYLRRGATPADAAERVKSVLFDYGNVSEAERRVLRRLIPFYTWTRKNITRQVENLVRRPGLTATEVKAFSGRNSENRQMTQFEGENLKLRLDSNGRNLTVLTGIDLPIKDLDRIWAGSASQTIRQNLAMVAPPIQAAIQVGTGKMLFSGRDIGRQESAAVGRIAEAAPKPIQQWLGYRKEMDAAGRPRYTFNGERFYMLFQSWAASRLVSTTDKQFKQYGSDPRWAPLMLDVLTGLRVKDLNLDDEQARRLKERQRQLQETLTRQGVLYEGTHYGRSK